MPNDLVTQLQNLRNLSHTNRSNRAVENRPNSEVADPLTTPTQEVDWQLAYAYLDSEMFSFVLKNRDNPMITKWGIEIADILSLKFGLKR